MTRPLLVAACVATLIAACAGDHSGTAADTVRNAPSQASGLPHQLGTRPRSACGWIPVEDVAAVVGKLNGEPREEDAGCFYPLPLDSITKARRALAEKVRASLASGGLQSDLPPEPEDTGGVRIVVGVGVGPEERPAELAFATLGSWIGDDSIFSTQKATKDWDYRRRMIGKPNFWGRAGTLMVVVESRTFGMQSAALATLAARVRDRIPDLPFAHPAAAGAARPGADPCAILSRREAEEVLGALTVPPYRVREGGALADPAGDSCAYYTGRHRALVITPHAAGGADEMRFVRGHGGLAAVGVVDRAAAGADTLEGPWDEAAIGASGELGVLRGDRLLKIAYLTSSTDLAGSMKLAVPALKRLDAMR